MDIEKNMESGHYCCLGGVYMPIITIAEAAVLAGKSQKTIRRAVAAGKLKSTKIQNKTRIERENAFLRSINRQVKPDENINPSMYEKVEPKSKEPRNKGR